MQGLGRTTQNFNSSGPHAIPLKQSKPKGPSARQKLGNSKQTQQTEIKIIEPGINSFENIDAPRFLSIYHDREANEASYRSSLLRQHEHASQGPQVVVTEKFDTIDIH